MVISHEPSFLNAVSTDIMMYTAERSLKYFHMSYADFIKSNGVFTTANVEDMCGMHDDVHLPPATHDRPKRDRLRRSSAQRAIG